MSCFINSESRYGVIGYGTWATALVKVLSENLNEVRWFVKNHEVLDCLLTVGRNPRYLNELEFDRSFIVPSNDINEVIDNSDVVVLAVPSAYLKNYLENLRVPLDQKFIVSAIKGIIPEDYKTVTEYIHDKYSIPFHQLGVITGPSHAEEVSQGKLSYLTMVCPDLELAEAVGPNFKTNYIKLNYSTDLYGVEYAAVLKNIYALAVGLAVGLGYGDNFLAVLIANCANEMKRILETGYPAERNLDSSAYLGDLLVTGYSTYSRNRRLGLLVGHGCTVKSALSEMTMVAEGYFAVDCIHHVMIHEEVEMPIVEMVYDVFYKGESARKKMKEVAELLH